MAALVERTVALSCCGLHSPSAASESMAGRLGSHQRAKLSAAISPGLKPSSQIWLQSRAFNLGRTYHGGRTNGSTAGEIVVRELGCVQAYNDQRGAYGQSNVAQQEEVTNMDDSLRNWNEQQLAGYPSQDINPAESSEKCDAGEKPLVSKALTRLACGLCAALTVATALPSFAGGTNQTRLPPLSTDPARCQRAYDGNTIGQANGVTNITLDLRFCDYSNDLKNLKGKTLSSALMSGAKFDGADLSEVIMSKAYAVGASFIGTNFTNGVVDRVAFDKSDLRGVKFINTVLSGSTFDGANLEGASFEDALIGYVDIKNLCLNPTLSGENRDDLGCK